MRLLTLLCVLCFLISNVTHAQSISERKKQVMQGKERDDRGSQPQEQISDEARKRFAEVQKQMRSGEIKFIGDRPTFRIKLNPALNYSMEELTGLKEGGDDKFSKFSDQVIEIEKGIVAEALKKGVKLDLPSLRCTEKLTRFDWRSLGKVTPVKDQNPCGSCAYFSSLAAWEGSYAIRNNVHVDSSEQRLLSCTTGSCSGESLGDVAAEMLDEGTSTEAAYPYVASNTACNTTIATPYNTINTARVDPSVHLSSVDEIQQAICDHGPVVMAFASTPAFQAYSSGIFNEQDPRWVNHGMTIVGWDDRARDPQGGGYWIVKNSWGTDWGEDGYARIDYNSNKVGYWARWYDAPYLRIMPVAKWHEAFRKKIPGYPFGGR